MHPFYAIASKLQRASAIILQTTNLALPQALRVRLLFRAAQCLHRRARAPAALPALLFFTDPHRMPDPLLVAATLPRGAGVVFRGFGAQGSLRRARTLARICRRRGILLLIGADENLARRVGAQGVHIPERLMKRPAKLRQGLVTTAAHGPQALRRAARLGARAALLSPVFPSKSPSAKQPLGLRRARAMASHAQLPVYALGGVCLRRLPIGPFCGIAAIEALL